MMPVELGDPLGPGLAVMLGDLLSVHEEDLARVVVWVDLERDDAKRLERWW